MTPSGIVLLDKKPGITSMASDNFIKKRAGTKKVGHSGTLDPFATGLLPIFVGDALKVVRYTDDYDKAYRCTARFGLRTDTMDSEGEVISRKEFSPEELSELSASDFKAIRDAFSEISEITEQMPPSYSAKKIDGRKAYELAREGQKVELQPCPVKIFSLLIDSIGIVDGMIDVTFDVSCSKGTYIRVICDDVGEMTGFHAHAIALRRTACGPFRVEDAITEDEISEMAGKGDFSFLLDRALALSQMEKMELTAPEFSDVKLGRKIKAGSDIRDGIFYAAYHKGELAAVLKKDGDIMRIDRMLARI